jgi:hypothetical protein
MNGKPQFEAQICELLDRQQDAWLYKAQGIRFLGEGMETHAGCE